MTKQTPPSAHSGSPTTGDSPSASQRQHIPWVAWAASAIAVTIALALVGIIVLGTVANPPEPATNVMPHINRASATVLQLDPLTGTPLKAPDFSLTDQSGRPLTLAQFAGESVVLTFNDDKCDDLCTLLAQDVVAADRDLAGAAKNVAFVSVNANPFFPQVSAVKSWTDAHGLGDAANWYYGTAAPALLRTVWASYGVPVEADAATKSVTHGAEIFFIDPSGNERALGQFGTESADTAVFAHTMAQAAVDLLPAAGRSAVAGPSAMPPQDGGVQIGATPSAISLPVLGAPTSNPAFTTEPGKYQVVNFWSSTCTACVRELPELQKASIDLGASISFVGIDVSDASDAGQAFARRAGVTYPLLADRNGSVAGYFQVSGLPYTVILDPQGTVLVRHPGTFTSEQLEYVMRTFDQSLDDAHQ